MYTRLALDDPSQTTEKVTRSASQFSTTSMEMESSFMMSPVTIASPSSAKPDVLFIIIIINTERLPP